MSINIVPQEQLAEQNDKTSIISKIPLLFYPNPKTLYQHRAKRMAFLAKDSPFADYLNFCAKIVLEQAKLIENSPIKCDLTNTVTSAAQQKMAPLSISHYPLDTQWIDYLSPIMDAVVNINAEIDQTIEALAQNTVQQLTDKANLLRNGQFEQVNNNEALFIWSAMSVYYSQLAHHLPGKAVAQMGEHRWLCPVCQSSPVASIVHLGSHVGLRYLHCSLCESEWYVPRSKCTNCDNMENITYYSLDDALSAVKTECCDHCHSYLKVFNQERDPHLDIIADDINSLVLDMETEQEKFAKSGVNPLLLST